MLPNNLNTTKSKTYMYCVCRVCRVDRCGAQARAAARGAGRGRGGATGAHTLSARPTRTLVYTHRHALYKTTAVRACTTCGTCPHIWTKNLRNPDPGHVHLWRRTAPLEVLEVLEVDILWPRWVARIGVTRCRRDPRRRGLAADRQCTELPLLRLPRLVPEVVGCV